MHAPIWISFRRIGTFLITFAYNYYFLDRSVLFLLHVLFFICRILFSFPQEIIHLLAEAFCSPEMFVGQLHNSSSYSSKNQRTSPLLLCQLSLEYPIRKNLCIYEQSISYSIPDTNIMTSDVRALNMVLVCFVCTQPTESHGRNIRRPSMTASCFVDLLLFIEVNLKANYYRNTIWIRLQKTVSL